MPSHGQEGLDGETKAGDSAMFVVFPTPGDRIFQNGDDHEEGGSREEELECCGEIDKIQ